MKQAGIILSIIIFISILLSQPISAQTVTDGIYLLSEVTATWDGTDASRTKATSADYDYTYGDEDSITYTLPWSINFYGANYNQIIIDTNGYIRFGSTVAKSFNLATTGIGPVITPWNNDLSSYYYGGVFVQHKTNPERVIIEWQTETYTEEGYYLPNDFEAVIFQNSSIRFDYRNFTTLAGKDFGSGISRNDGSLYVNLTNAYGNVYALAGKSFAFEEIPLTLTIDPTNTLVNTQNVTVSGTKTAGATVTVSADTAAVIGPITYPTPVTWSTTISGLATGDNTLTVAAHNAVGKTVNAGTHIIYDNIPPSGTITINGGAAISGSTQVSLALSANDTNGVFLMSFSNDGNSWTDAEPYAATRVWFLPSGDGQKRVFVRYRDAAGNWSTDPIVASIVLDTTAPVVTATPAGGIYRTAQSVRLEANEVATIYFTTDGSTPTTASAIYGGPVSIASSTTLKWLAIDSAGNSGSHTETYVIDTIPPVLTVSTLADGSYTNKDILNVTGTVTDNIGVKELLINGVSVPFDSEGKFSYAMPLTTGKNQLEIKATDTATNPVSDSRTIYLDQKAPLLSVAAPADNSKTGTALIEVTGTVDETSTVDVALKGVTQPVTRDGNAFTSSVTLVPGPLPNTIEITATDQANNTSSDKRTVYYDDQAPSLAITLPGQDISTNQGSLVIRGTASDLYGYAVRVSLDMNGQKFTPQVINGQFEQIVTFTTEGTYRIVATATNEADTSTSVQRNVIYDVTPPPLTIDPVTSPTSQPAQVISGTREAGSVVNVTCDTATVGAVDYPSATTWNVTLAGMRTGENIITATTQDLAGNTNTASARILVQGNEPEIVVSASPAVIWPPNHKMIKVTIGGKLNIPVSDVQTIDITLTDEYGKYNYKNLKFGDTVLLEAWRDGTDKDGRVYSIKVVVTHKDGRKSGGATTVLVPHDMGN